MSQSSNDPRRRIPATDSLLELPAVHKAHAHLHARTVRAIIERAQNQARSGAIAPEDVVSSIENTLTLLTSSSASALTPVFNATGIVIHTNLGRAPLPPQAREALIQATSYVNVEMDLATGKRSNRGVATTNALLTRIPQAEDVLVVNNCAAALVLATTALAQQQDVLISRGEYVEIGAGFRLSELMESTGAHLREVGTTNRTHLADYSREFDRTKAGRTVGAVVKVHLSNFWQGGFTTSVSLSELCPAAHTAGIPVIADVGAGLLESDPLLPHEISVSQALDAGADLVVCSGDKLLGGPQAGIIFGRADLVRTLATHPLARALRVDKLTLAALEATVQAASTPVADYLHTPAEHLRERTQALADTIAANGHTPPAVLSHAGRTGGGAGAGVPLPGWALALPTGLAAVLRTGTPSVVARVHKGTCYVDLRCVPAEHDDTVAHAICAALDKVRQQDTAP